MSVLWVIARSAGLVSMVALTATVVFGIVSSADFPKGTWSRWLRKEVHRRIALVACAMLGLHIAAVVLDSFVDVGWVNVIVPFSSTYDRLGIGLAAISIDLIIVLVATSLAQKHLRFVTWQVIHVTAYLAWPIAILHGLVSGTDDLLTWLLALVGALAVVTVATIRIGHQRKHPASASVKRPSVSA
ncbi:MAG: ferric reductase-like transmembrane domain-containing protein [Actinobacteria bacterium]|nr:ferric reductase-like transmembrane domain-containing protein [Actinomycetota bacterium]